MKRSLVVVEPLRHERGNEFGLLEVARVAAVGNDENCGIDQGVCHRGGDRSKFVISLTNNKQRWHRNLIESRPEIRLGAHAELSKAASQTFCRVVPAAGKICGGDLEVGEERLAEPLLQEGFDADCFDHERQSLVTGSTLLSLVTRGDAGSGADQNESGWWSVTKGGGQGESATHGVAEKIVWRVETLGDESCAPVERGVNRRTGTMPRQVEGNDATMRRQLSGNLAPRGAGLRETMAQEQWRTSTDFGPRKGGHRS